MEATKTLAEMTAEVVEVNTANGWYENCATFPEALALLHSEVSEALDAWREKGLESWYVHATPSAVPKPEGVPSEFADIFIRLLDDAWIFGQVDLEAAAPHWRYAVSKSFPTNMNTLHDMISKVSAAASEEPEAYVERLGSVLVFLRQLCEKYGIDLEAEYELKLAYNRTRGYRHGNRRI